jgi:hypothetical protein
VKLYGTSVAIGKSLEIGEGYAPNVFSAAGDGVSNPHQLTFDEMRDRGLSHATLDGSEK